MKSILLFFGFLWLNYSTFSQGDVIFLHVQLDDPKDYLHYPKNEDVEAQPTQGYEDYLRSFVDLIKADTFFTDKSVSSIIKFTVLEDGSLDYFGSDDNAEIDSLLIEKIKGLGNWQPLKNSTQKISLNVVTKDQLVFTRVEEPATFPGGIFKFYEYINAELEYPEAAKRRKVEGRVFLQFIVEKDGSLSDIKIIKGIGAGCDEEAVRLLTNSPTWIPAKQRGETVRLKMIQQITIKLNRKKTKF